MVTKSLLVGRATKPSSDIENTLCVTSVAGRRERERRRGESRLLAPSREGAPGCSALCVRYWTDSIFAFFLPLCPFLSLSAPSRSCFSSYLLALPSLLPPPFFFSFFTVRSPMRRGPEVSKTRYIFLRRRRSCLTMRTIVPFFWRFRFLAVVGNFYYILSDSEYVYVRYCHNSNVHTLFLTLGEAEGDIIAALFSILAMYLDISMGGICKA